MVAKTRLQKRAESGACDGWGVTLDARADRNAIQQSCIRLQGQVRPVPPVDAVATTVERSNALWRHTIERYIPSALS